MLQLRKSVTTVQREILAKSMGKAWNTAKRMQPNYTRAAVSLDITKVQQHTQSEV